MASRDSTRRVHLELPAPVVGAVSVLAILALVVILRDGRSLLIPFVLSILLSYALAPVVGWLERWRIPRLLATTLVMAALGTAIVGATIALQTQALAVIEDLPRAARQLREQLESSQVAGGTIDKLRQATSEIERVTQAVSPGPRPASAPVLPVSSLLWWGSAGLIAAAGHAAAIFFLVFFMLLSGNRYRQKLLNIAGRLPRRRITSEVLEEIDHEIKRYLLARILTSVIVGVATWIVLASLGLNHAIVWALGAAICNWIPYLGPFLVSGSLLVVGLLQFGSLPRALAVSGAALAVTALEGWLIDPPLMGKVERMNTVAVLVGLMFWTLVWGAWGTLLAVPMLAVTKTICDRIDGLRPVGELLGK
jgi:predicted PurR-regulated permease PerM